MLSPQHSTAKSVPTEPSGEHTSPPEDNQFPPVDPYLPDPTWTYLKYLIPLLAICTFTLTFTSYVLAKGRVPAPQRLAGFVMSNPQVKAQLVAILATSFTATTRWGLGGAAALLARKRLLRPCPVYQLDMFFSLRNISVVWDWEHRRRTMVLTSLLVAVCGLLTSGFVALLNPIPMEVHKEHPPAQEFNFAAEIASQEEWDFNWMRFVLSAGSRGTQDSTAILSDVPSLLQSMTSQYVASKVVPLTRSTGSFVTSFRELGYTSFVGSTAGAVTSGELVYQGAIMPVLPLGRPDYPSYSLDLQGTWIDVSCSMGKVSPLNVTTTQDLSQFILWGDTINYRFTCPGSSVAQEDSTRFMPSLVLAFACPMESGATDIFFKTLDDMAAVDNITCSVSPQIGDVVAVLNPDIQAFNVTKKSSPTLSPSSVTRNFTSLILEHVIHNFKNLPILAATEEVRTIGVKDSMLPELMAMSLKTIFEFEASYARLKLSTAVYNSGRLLPKFTREVEVVLIDHTVGWEMKWTTLLGLAPLVVVCVITFTMIVMAAIAEGKLTVFDPMNPVSLLAATSVGEVAFPNQAGAKAIGDPLDKNVLATRVSYANKNGRLGLWSSEGSSNGAVKYESLFKPCHTWI